MAKLGKLPTRSSDSFGVVGLLGDGCKIYYDSIFSARHIGRVSDLLTAQLKSVGSDELRFRIILMFSLYEGYRSQLDAIALADGDVLAEPLVVECGVDEEKIAVGVAFTFAESEVIDLAALPQKIKSASVSSRLEKFIAQMAADSDQVVVRLQPESRRIEIVSLIGLPGKIDVNQNGERRAVEIFILKPESKVSPLKADYVELADLDYNRLLQEDAPGAPKDRPATGEILARGAEEIEAVTRISGEKSSEEMITRISGATDQIASNTQEMRVKKLKKKAAADPAGEVDGESEDSEADDEDSSSDAFSPDLEGELSTAKKKVGLYQSRIAQLQHKIEVLEVKRQTETVIVSDIPAAEISKEAQIVAEQKTLAQRGAKITQMIKSLFKRKRSDDSVEESELPSALSASSSAAAPEADVQTVEMDPETGELLRGQVERLEQTIERMRQEAQALKSEPGSSRAQKWVENTVGELLAEKARVNDMAKKLGLTLRQKEHEFRSRENLIREELKRKEEQVRQKTSALDRAKEQLSQMAITVERSKTQQQGSSEEGQLRSKLNFTQKLLQGAQTENAAQARKVDELKNQLMLAQSASASKPRTAGEADIATLKVKYDRMVKQNEEFKRANQALLEKVNEVHKPKAGGMTAEEMKKKLEMAMRLAANYQKEAEQGKLKIEELQREESRIKGELNRTNNSLRALKASAAAHGKRDDDPNGSQAA